MDVTAWTVYDAPRDRVAACAGNPSNAPSWFGKVASVRWRGDPVPAEGARVDLVSRFLGREVVYAYRLVDLVPAERLVMRTEQGPFPVETTMTWWDEEPVEGRPRTGMSLRTAGRPRGMTTLASGATTLAMKRALRRDLERLRPLLTQTDDVG